MQTDDAQMARALELAERGWGRVSPNPMVGALVLSSAGDVVGQGWHEGPGTDHAEVMALHEAGDAARGGTVVVTLEPCAMCAGALAQARVARLVYGADDPKAGAVATLWDLLRDPRLPHRVEVHRGVLADDCAELLRAFFRQRRGRR
jgi:tRNA(adenine34) deaminase